jgi:hypothetical protein
MKINVAIASAFVGIVALAFADNARAASFTVDFEQVGVNVVATGSGFFDLTGLSYEDTTGTGNSIIPDRSVVIVSYSSAPATDFYSATYSGPGSFGPGGTTNQSGSGDPIWLNPSSDEIGVPQGYASGTEINDGMTFDNATLASLGLTAGVYNYTYGSAADQDYTVEIGVAATPLPAALPLFAGGLGMVGFLSRRGKRKAGTLAAA